MKRFSSIAAALLLAISAFAGITYELNGGTVSTYAGPQDMYADLNQDYNAATGDTAVWPWITNPDSMQYGIPTHLVACDITFFTDTAKGAVKWGWLCDYMTAMSVKYGKDLPTKSSSYMRYHMAAFFCDCQRTGWPVSPDYTHCGVSSPDAYSYYWRSAFANPTDPQTPTTLRAPYKHGCPFEGWYESADFTGERITTVDASTSGTLYAKWGEYVPTAAEIKALEDNTATRATGVVVFISGKTVFIQDPTGGLHLYMQTKPTFAIGDRIVVEGTKTTYRGNDEVNYAVVLSSEPATLPDVPAFGKLSDVCNDTYVNTRVRLNGLQICSIDNNNNPYLTDGTDTILYYKMAADPAVYKVGKRVNVTAAVNYSNGYQLWRDSVSTCELINIDKRDPYEYPVRGCYGQYQLTNSWTASYTEGNFEENKPGNKDYVRGMDMHDGVMYFLDRETESLVPVECETADLRLSIKIRGNHLFQKQATDSQDAGTGEWSSAVSLPFNDLHFDNAGNCLIGASIVGNQRFMIYKVDLQTGYATPLIDEAMYENASAMDGALVWPGRFDAFGVYGDVDGHAIIMAADSYSFNVYKWTITNGIAGAAEKITCQLDESILEYRSSDAMTRIMPVSYDAFYVDGSGISPILFDMTGEPQMWTRDLIAENNPGETCSMDTRQNGMCEFTLGRERYIVMATGNNLLYESKFVVCRYASEDRTSPEPMWYFPSEGLGDRSNTSRAALVSAEANGDSATICIYTVNNGYAVYKMKQTMLAVAVVSDEHGQTSGGGPYLYGEEAQISAVANIGYEFRQWSDGNTENPRVITVTQDTTLTAIFGMIAGTAQEIFTVDQDLYPTETEVREGTEMTAVDAGESFYSGIAFDVKNAFPTTYKRVALNPNQYTTLYLGSTAVIVPDQWGIQGNDNPKDADVANPALSNRVPVQGAVFQIDAKQDGYVCVLVKAVSNKHYTVFEISNGEATSMGYDLAMITCPAGKEALKTKVSWLSGTMCSDIILDSLIRYSPTVDADGYVIEGGIVFPEIPMLKDHPDYGHLADSASIMKSGAYGLSGLGVITFPVKANTSYYVNGCVTKIQLASVAFLTDAEAATLPVYVSDGNQTILLMEKVADFYPQDLCGNSLQWSYADGVLTISGTGDMYDFAADSVPWKLLRDSITAVVLPEGITHIGSYAFSDCTGLTSVTIPNSITSIGKWAFYNAGLTSVHISDLGCWCNIQFSSRDSNPLTYAHNLYLNGELVTNPIIPESVSSIGQYAFDGCTGFATVEIGNSVISIGNSAFNGCSGLASVAIGSYVTSIGSTAFANCSGLTSVTIPNSVTSIGSWAFGNCTGLTSVIIPNSVTSISGYTFIGCTSLTSATIPNSVTSIMGSAFRDCTGLTSVTIPNSVTSIGNKAFDGCTGLSSILMESCTPPSIQSGAFSSTSIDVVVPVGARENYLEAPFWSNLTNIRERYSVLAFAHDDLGSAIYTIDCDSSQVVLIATPKSGYHFMHWSDGNTDNPRNVVVDRDTAFTAIFGLNYSGICGENLTWTYADSTLTISGTGDMYDFGESDVPWCLFRDSITAVVLPDGITHVGTYAFSSIPGLTEIACPESLASIGDHAFQNAGFLTSAAFGAQLTSVGDSAFAGCIRMETMTVRATVTPSTGSGALDDLSSRMYLYVPMGRKHAYEVHPVWGRFDIREIGSSNVAGDANGDNEVDVQDVSATVEHILGHNPEPFDRTLADVDGDMVVDVCDVAQIVNIILYGYPSNMPMRRAASYSGLQPVLTGNSIAAIPSSDAVLTLSLADAGYSFTALQLDMELPEGLALKSASLGSRTLRHTLSRETLPDGTVRLLLYSMGNAALTAEEGSVLQLELTADASYSQPSAEIRLTGITAAATAGQKISLGNTAVSVICPVATGIDNVSASGEPGAEDNLITEKFFRDGILYIRRGEHLYDATGRMVE